MTSTFSRASDAPSQNVEQLTNSKPDFNVVSLLKEHPSRTSDARTSGSSDPDKLDFGSVHQLYGAHDGDHGHHHEGGHHHHHDGNDGGKDGSSDSAKDDSSLPVELVDAADEIKRAQEAFKNGDPDRAKEWLQHAEKNLRALTGDDSSPGDKCGGSDSGHGGSSDSGHEGGSDSGHEGGSDSGHEGGSDSGHEGGSEGGSEAPPPSDQQIQLQQMIATLAQALQALANGDMQQFQQLLSGLLAQVNQMMPPEQGGTDEPPAGGTEPWTSVPGADINDPTGSGDGSINPITGLPNPFSGLPNPLTGLPGLPELPGLPHFSNGDSNSDNGFQLPGLPSIQLPGFPNLNGSDNSSGGIQLPGLPSIDLPGLPSIQLPGLPSIGNGSDNGIGIPGLPNLPGLPELPNLPGLPKLPGLPGLSGGGSDSNSGGLPKLPGLPDLGDIFDFF